MNPPPEILNLITRFERNIDSYRSPAYNEAQLRLEFLNPFFQALGWDVYNTRGYAEAYKEVIHEDAIKIDKSIRKDMKPRRSLRTTDLLPPISTTPSDRIL